MMRFLDFRGNWVSFFRNAWDPSAKLAKKQIDGCLFTPWVWYSLQRTAVTLCVMWAGDSDNHGEKEQEI